MARTLTLKNSQKNRSGLPLKTSLFALLLLLIWGGLFGVQARLTQDPADEEYSPVAFGVDYKQLTLDADPEVAMDKLQSELKLHPELESSCHGIVHEIGHTAYKKYGFQKALLGYENDLCGSGYMHGVTEEYIENSQNPLQDMLTACPADYGACFHGIGHGLLLYYENELPKALAGCNQLPEDKQKVQCSEGVFMQNFGTDTKIHTNDYLNPADTLFPCSSQKELYQSACYFYSPRYFLKLHDRDYWGALNTCAALKDDARAQCIRGVGSATMKQNIEDFEVTKSLCNAAEPDDQKTCYSGATSYYVIHSGSLQEAESLCSHFEKPFERVCEATVQGSADFFMD